jgi:hypothetical protein
MSKEASSSSESVPILGKGRVNIDTWERRFNDYSISKKWRGLFRGTEERPLEINHAELQMIPTASRYNATRDRKKEIEDFNDRYDSTRFLSWEVSKKNITDKKMKQFMLKTI